MQQEYTKYFFASADIFAGFVNINFSLFSFPSSWMLQFVHVGMLLLMLFVQLHSCPLLLVSFRCFFCLLLLYAFTSIHNCTDLNSLKQNKGVICLHRKVALKDHKLVYWLAGGLSALSVLLEKKARRGELALYVLPRAGESLWYILVNRRLLPDIKNAEVILWSFCGNITYPGAPLLFLTPIFLHYFFCQLF